MPTPKHTEKKTDCNSCYMKHRGCLSQGLEGNAEKQFKDLLDQPPRLRRGEKLTQTLHDQQKIFIVRSGSLKGVIPNPNKNENTITSFYFPGDIIGIEHLCTKSFRLSYIALEPTHVCALLCHDLREMIKEHHEISGPFITQMARQIHAQDQALSLVSTNSAKQRIAGFLLALSKSNKRQGVNKNHLNMTMTRDDIASYLGLARATASRALGYLQSIGAIEVSLGKCVILDMEKLEHITKAALKKSENQNPKEAPSPYKHLSKRMPDFKHKAQESRMY